MYDGKDDMPPVFWEIINEKGVQEERQPPLQLYSEDLLEYILEKLHETEQKYAELDVTRN